MTKKTKNQTTKNINNKIMKNKIILFSKKILKALRVFISRVLADGGIIEAKNYVNSVLKTVSDASLVLIPSAYKTGVLYSILPEDGTGDFTASRNSVATRINPNGLIEEVGVNIPRIDYTDGTPVLLTEPQSTNLYLNSDILVSQNITTLASDYTVSFYGLGTINFTGTYTGSLVGTGLNDRVQLTFTATAGTLISTVVGVATYGQCENLPYATSYIPTEGATATRLGELVTDGGDVNTFNSEEGVLFVEMSALSADGTNRYISISDSIFSNYVGIYFSSTNSIVARVVIGGVTTYISANAVTQTNNFKIALKWKLNDYSIWVNGIEKNTNNTLNAFPTNTFTNLSFKRSAVSDPFYGKTKQIQVFKTALSDAELTELTTI